MNRRTVLVSPADWGASKLKLNAAESAHLKNVLRARVGESIQAVDGEGRWAETKIAVLHKSGSELEIIKQDKSERGSEICAITLEMSLIRNDNMALVIEKSVELGVDSIRPVAAERSVVKVKGVESLLERWQRIADQALKQCGRRHRLRFEIPVHVSQLPQGAIRLWADEGVAGDPSCQLGRVLKETSPDQVSILIGPEGGWSEAEHAILKSNQSTPVALNPRILRAETAAISSCAIAADYLLSR